MRNARIAAGRAALTLAVLALVTWGGSAEATSLGLDFGYANAGNQVQSGFEDFSLTSTDAAPNPQVRTYSSALATSGTITATLSAANNLLGSRDRGDVAHDLGLGDVLEDFVFHKGARDIALTLDGLKAGTYALTTWNHDKNTSQQPFNVLVDDAIDTGQVKAVGLSHSTGDAPLFVGGARTSFVADGVNPVTVHINEQVAGGGGVPVLSGLLVSDAAVPGDLKVDIGANAPQDVQVGFQPFTRGPLGDALPNLGRPHTETYHTALGIADSVTAVLDASSTGVGFRRRADVAGDLGDLAEDFAFNRAGTQLFLTLRDLEPGTYFVQSYFHDEVYDHHKIDLAVDDALGAGRVQIVGLQQSTGASPAEVASGIVSIVANGVDPVVVRYTEQPGALVVLSGFTVEPHRPDSLRVDFGRAGSGNDVQSGFDPFSLPQDNSNASPQTRSFSTGLGAAGSVDLTLRSSTTLGSRDRDDVTHLLGDLAEDFIYNSEPDDELVMELAGLKPGLFAMTAYFHDTLFSQGALDIAVDDALGTARSVADAIVQSTGAAPGSIANATFLFQANGVDPVTVYFAEHASASNIALSGISITQVVPEPASLGLLGLGALALLRRRRPRR